MEIRKILADLIGERNRIARAIAALWRWTARKLPFPRGRPAAAAKAAPKQPGKRGLTPAGRRRLSAMMKARWAARRKAAAPPQKARRETGAWPSPNERGRQKKDRRGAESKMGRAEKSGSQKSASREEGAKPQPQPQPHRLNNQNH